ncbi:MAG: hypothetical protein M1834_006354 [Cirrosporium novae-zelandiae]|nr:MAG: hypothetical protein M1834_006354 [Cirrosporium novae-zelandiae]
MAIKYLITGATGGLGASILHHLSLQVAKADLVASSSRASAASQFEDVGIPFRQASYDNYTSLVNAFHDVEKLLFVSSPTMDNKQRERQHMNVIKAAKEAGVKHIYYTSLSFGGHASTSKVLLQLPHLQTEKWLWESSVPFTSVREGVYAEAFPVFTGWYPASTEIVLPVDGPIAWVSREELGEATAKLMFAGSNEFNGKTVLFTGPKAYTMADILDVVNQITGRLVTLKKVSGEEFIRIRTANDEGKKREVFFRAQLTWFDGIARGECAAVDPLIEKMLGRPPKDGKEVIRELLQANRDYTWHQNYKHTI